MNRHSVVAGDASLGFCGGYFVRMCSKLLLCLGLFLSSFYNLN